MATIPKLKGIKEGTTSAQIINAVMNDTASVYSQTPSARAVENDVKSIHLIGSYMENDIDLSNAFIKQLINRIVKVVYTKLYFENPWKRFKRGMLEAGDAIEEIAFDLCDPHDFDSTTDYEYPQQEKEALYVEIHRLNYQKYYKKTVNRKKLLQAFSSARGMEDLVQELIRTMYVTAEVDEYTTMKYLVGRALLNGLIVPVKILPTSDANMKSIASSMKGVSNNMELAGTQYNRFGLPTSTAKRNQIVLINTDFDAQFEVEVLAYAFNMDKADIYGQRVFINPWTAQDVQRLNKLFKGDKNYVPFTSDELSILNSVPAYVVDDRFFMVFDYLLEMTTFMNPEKLYWNYWLHTWRVMSVSPFVNAVAFTSNVADAATVTITNTVLSVVPGGSLAMKSTVSAATSGKSESASTASAALVNQSVIWTVSGNTSRNTYIMETGMLYVGDDEQSAEITVTASTTGADYAPISGTATVTVKGNEKPDTEA